MPDASDRRVPKRKDTLTHEVTDTDEVVIYDGNGPQLLVLNDIAAGVWLMIDGKRSIREMASVLEKQRLMSQEEAIPAIRSFLTKMYDDAQRQTGY